MIKQFLIRWAINGLGLWLASELISGVNIADGWVAVAIAALVFSIINAFIRPILVILSLPAIILTLGLFTLVINAFILYLVMILYAGFSVSTFTAALLTVVIMWVVNFAGNTILKR
ncbi:MAG: phage holin family protein [Candidatus Saccharimonadales bacterium]